MAKAQFWHSPEWGARFSEALERRGWQQQDYGRVAKMSDPQVSRLAAGHVSLRRVVQACMLLGLAPPEGCLDAAQTRLLEALAHVQRYLEERWDFELDEDGKKARLPEVSLKTIEMFVSTVEAEAARIAGPSQRGVGADETDIPLTTAR